MRTMSFSKSQNRGLSAQGGDIKLGCPTPKSEFFRHLRTIGEVETKLHDVLATEGFHNVCLACHCEGRLGGVGAVFFIWY